MKAKKILTLIVALAMCLASVSSLTAITAFAADTVILDTNVKANITKAGATADSKNVNKTKYSVKWKTDDGDLRFKGLTTDFTAGNTLNFSMKLDSTEAATLMLYFGSENSATDGIDYWRYDLKNITPGEWKDYSVDLTKLSANRTPLGWDKVGDFSFRVLGWANKAAAGSVVYIENIYLSGDKMSASSGTDSGSSSASSTVVSEIEENKNKIFYWSDFNNADVDISTGASVVPKSNKVEHAFDSGDNGYVDMAITGEADDAYFEATLKDTYVNKMVVELDVKTENGMPGGSLQYKDSPDRKQGTLMSFSGTTITAAKETVAEIKKGKWTHIGFLFDLSKNKAEIYVDGEKALEYAPGATSNNLSLMRLYLGKGADKIGKDLQIDNFAVYAGDKFRDDIAESYVAPTPAKPKAKAEVGPDVEMPVPDISKIGNGVALKINNSNAYAKGAMTKVDLENEAVVPVIVDSRTLVPVRFISESFDAEVSWDDAARKVTVKSADKTIELTIDSNVMTVNGAEQTIDVPAAIMESRTMLPLRALVEALGKNVLWDTRGLIVITDKDITLDAEADVKLSTMLIGKLENGVEAKNYAAAPVFTQSIIDDAIKAPLGNWRANSGNSTPGEKSANAIYYLTLAARMNPNAAGSDGTLCKDATLKQIRHLISGGVEPFACVGCYWGHAIVAASMVLVKNTPVVYDELTADEKDRIDWLMRCLAIAGNWAYNDQNNYTTGFDLCGNFGKGWNPNYRNTYLSIVLSASMYFGAEELDKIFVEFDYDTYIAKLTELGFTNILATWTVAGKDLMENGGECTLIGIVGLTGQKVGESGGTGVGVKVPFKYNGMGAGDLHGLFKNLLDFTYPYKVVSEWNDPGTEAHAYILDNKISPFQGQMGMMKEFASGTRSKCGYCYDSFMILNTVYANMKLFGGWNSSTAEMREYDNRQYVGNEDLIYKYRAGYHGHASYANSVNIGEEYEYSTVSRGGKYVKDIWRNFHLMLNEQVEVMKDPNAVELAPIAAATPKEGDGNAPAGAMANAQLTAGSTFPAEAYHMLGKEMTKGTLEFDIVLGNNITIDDYDCVVMPAKKLDEQKWATANMLIQFTGGTIKVRNGSKYVNSMIQFGANYRYHVKVTFDVPTKKYTVELNEIYPSTGEVYKAENYDFRTGGTAIDFIDSIAIVNTPNNSTMWIENLVISE